MNPPISLQSLKSFVACLALATVAQAAETHSVLLNEPDDRDKKMVQPTGVLALEGVRATSSAQH